jgi:hypothetical protein
MINTIEPQQTHVLYINLAKPKPLMFCLHISRKVPIIHLHFNMYSPVNEKALQSVILI